MSSPRRTDKTLEETVIEHFTTLTLELDKFSKKKIASDLFDGSQNQLRCLAIQTTMKRIVSFFSRHLILLEEMSKAKVCTPKILVDFFGHNDFTNIFLMIEPMNSALKEIFPFVSKINSELTEEELSLANSIRDFSKKLGSCKASIKATRDSVYPLTSNSNLVPIGAMARQDTEAFPVLKQNNNPLNFSYHPLREANKAAKQEIIFEKSLIQSLETARQAIGQFLSFPFETVGTEQDRTRVLQAYLTWAYMPDNNNAGKFMEVVGGLYRHYSISSLSPKSFDYAIQAIAGMNKQLLTYLIQPFLRNYFTYQEALQHFYQQPHIKDHISAIEIWHEIANLANELVLPDDSQIKEDLNNRLYATMPQRAEWNGQWQQNATVVHLTEPLNTQPINGEQTVSNPMSTMLTLYHLYAIVVSALYPIPTVRLRHNLPVIQGLPKNYEDELIVLERQLLAIINTYDQATINSSQATNSLESLLKSMFDRLIMINKHMKKTPVVDEIISTIGQLIPNLLTERLGHWSSSQEVKWLSLPAIAINFDLTDSQAEMEMKSLYLKTIKMTLTRQLQQTEKNHTTKPASKHADTDFSVNDINLLKRLLIELNILEGYCKSKTDLGIKEIIVRVQEHIQNLKRMPHDDLPIPLSKQLLNVLAVILEHDQIVLNNNKPLGFGPAPAAPSSTADNSSLSVQSTTQTPTPSHT